MESSNPPLDKWCRGEYSFPQSFLKILKLSKGAEVGIKKSGATRRDFFRQSAVAAAVAPAVLGLGGETFGQVGKSDLQVGIIGTGGRGRSELTAIAKVPGVRVAALCDISPAALEEAKQVVAEHKPDTYSFHRDLLQRDDLQAVFVATPPQLHREQVV